MATPPHQVALYFSERADPAFTRVDVLDRQGRRVSQAASASSDGRRVVARVNQLSSGVYTVRWWALWSSDGHTTSGFFVFAIGQALQAVPAPAPEPGPSPVRVALRWISYAAAMILSGAVIFREFVLRAGISRAETDGDRLWDAAVARLRNLSIVAGAALLLAVAAEFTMQAADLLGGTVAEATGSGMIGTLLGGTKAGWSALVRISLAVTLLLPSSPGGQILRIATVGWVFLVGGLMTLLGGPGAVLGSTHVSLIVLIASVYGLVSVMAAIIVPQVPDLRAQIPDASWVQFFAATALMGGFAITAHASGEGVAAALVDVIHLTAAAAWIGGLFSLLVVLRAGAPDDHARLAQLLVPTFSTMAGVSLAVLILTGIYSTTLNVPALRAFLVTAYGRLLGIKLALVLLLAALGAFNHFVLRPRLASGGALPVVGRFMRSVGGEVGLGALILLIVASLTITPTSKVVMQTQAAAASELRFAGFADGVRVTLSVRPARAGWNRFELTAVDRSGAPIAAADARILLRLTKLDEELETAVVGLDPESEGRYTAEGNWLALPGWWELEVVV
ncbi:MAG: CopD family protein, partial [bacterium]